MGQELDICTWEHLSAYLDGALDPIEAAAVEYAVASDPGMAGELAVLRRQRKEMRAWARELDARPLSAGVQALLGRAREQR